MDLRAGKPILRSIFPVAERNPVQRLHGSMAGNRAPGGKAPPPSVQPNLGTKRRSVQTSARFVSHLSVQCCTAQKCGPTFGNRTFEASVLPSMGQHRGNRFVVYTKWKPKDSFSNSCQHQDFCLHLFPLRNFCVMKGYFIWGKTFSCFFCLASKPA